MENQKIDGIKDVIKKGSWRNLIIISGILLALFTFKPWVQVGAGERGIVQNFGVVQDNVLNEGIHLRIPVMQTVILMDVKIQKGLTDAVSVSSVSLDVD
jgi:regulator of protease activity HflC (stomatin/prohibitin superfamily)